VAEVLPLSDGELHLLESLIRHRVRFMVVGLSAAALQGAPVVKKEMDN
jgi:Ser/Thr protein kinase RdoA (MazF antagonist)